MAPLEADMSYFKFSNLIKKNKPIDVYNNGHHARDFTYIDDCTNIVIKLIKVVKSKKYLLNDSYYDVVNVACGKQIQLNLLIRLLSKNFNKQININYKPLQMGDVKKHIQIQKN